MERFREQADHADPLHRRAAMLFSAELPLDVSPFAEARVAARLAEKRRRAPARLRWGVVAFLVSAMAFAATWIARPLFRSPRPSFLVDSAHDLDSPVTPQMPHFVASPQMRASVVTPTASHEVARHITMRQTPPLTSPPAAALPPTSEGDHEAGLLAAATRALRVEHDAERAATLLEDHLRHYPNGALREEALALAMEAAILRKNNTDAAAFADEYLAHFPHGRFAALAERIERHVE